MERKKQGLVDAHAQLTEVINTLSLLFNLAHEEPGAPLGSRMLTAAVIPAIVQLRDVLDLVADEVRAKGGEEPRL